MKKVLIDLNIIIDMLQKRSDHKSAALLYDECTKGKALGFVASHEITTLSWFLEKKKIGISRRNEIIEHLLKTLTVLTPDEQILKKALYSSITDYEDAVIDELAALEKVDYIITGNIKDFKRSGYGHVVCSALEALSLIDSCL